MNNNMEWNWTKYVWKKGKRPDYVTFANEIQNSCDEWGEQFLKKVEWLNPGQIKSYMASFLTKPNTKSETSSSTLHVQWKNIPIEDVGHYKTLSEVTAVLETNDYNSNIENIVEED